MIKWVACIQTKDKSGSDEMKTYNVGKALYDYRVYYKLSQIQLCKGICSTATLSRIESGEREVDSLLAEMLLSRVGKTTDLFECILNEEDYWLSEKRQQISKNIIDKKVDQAEKLLNKYETNMPKNNILHKQFLFLHKAMLLKLKNVIQEKVIAMLHQAINLTRPDYLDQSKEKLYSFMEIKIIYELFFYESFNESLLSLLLQFMEKYYDMEEKERTMLPFLYHLSFQYEKTNKYEEMIQVTHKAISILSVGKSYFYMADFYFQKLKGEEKIYGLSDSWKNKRMKLVEECHNVFYMYMVEEKREKMKQVERFCKEKLQCQITM